MLVSNKRDRHLIVNLTHVKYYYNNYYYYYITTSETSAQYRHYVRPSAYTCRYSPTTLTTLTLTLTVPDLRRFELTIGKMPTPYHTDCLCSVERICKCWFFYTFFVFELVHTKQTDGRMGKTRGVGDFRDKTSPN